MEIQLESRDGVSIVHVLGDIDGLTAENLLGRLHAHVAEGHVNVVVDLSGVAYTSSAGLRALLGTVKQTRRGGGDLRLTAVTPNVLKVLELSGFTTIIKLYDGIDAAVASFAPAGIP